jgi:hypothetical protein
MAGLQVVSAPQNQPVLNSKVQSQPVNQPAFSPRVVTRPTQPAFNPQVQSQPQNQPRITSIGTAAEQRPYTQKLSLDEFAQTIKQKYPEYADRDNATLAQAMLAKYPQYQDKVYMPQPPQQEGERGIKGFGLGAVKGALNTVSNIGGLASKVASKIPNIALASPFGFAVGAIKGVGAIGDKLAPYKENFRPEGTAEKIGYGAEQIGEFFIPGGAISRGVKAVEKAAVALPKVAKVATNLGARAGLEAAGAAGVTALQGGSSKDIKTAGLIGGAFGAISKPIESIIQKLPETAWSSILKRTPTESAKNPKLPAQAAQTGMTAFGRRGLLNEAQRNIQQIEVVLDDLLTRSNGKIGTLKIAPYVDELRNAYKSIPGEQSSVDAINNVMRDLLKKKSLTVQEANQLKRQIYENIARSYGRGMLEIPVKTDAQKAIARGLKQEIEKVIPETKTLNEKQAVYIQIKKALDKTIARTEGKGIAGTGVGLYDLLIGGLGTGAGAVAGMPLAGLGLVAGKKTLESPMVLTATAKLLTYFNQLSPTKKLLFYEALKGLAVKGGLRVTNSTSPKTTK